MKQVELIGVPANYESIEYAVHQYRAINYGHSPKFILLNDVDYEKLKKSIDIDSYTVIARNATLRMFGIKIVRSIDIKEGEIHIV